ncbi:regulation of calcineurin-NFAT signaling cascade [Mactra antiquata]
MSTEENSHGGENNIPLSPGCNQDIKHELGNQTKLGNQTGLFLANGDKNVADFPISSASKLLKTIVIASQAANQQQQQQEGKTSAGNMEKPLPQDLQSFKGDPFTLQYANASQNSDQSSSPFVNGTQAKFNGVTSDIFRALVSVKQDTDPVNNALHINTEQSENISHNSSVPPSFESLNMQQKNGMLQRILSGDQIIDQNYHSPGGNFSVSSPTDFSKNSPASSANSPYGDSNLSPFADTTQSVCMDTDTQPTGFKDLMKTVTMSDTTTQSSLITHTGKLRLDSLNVDTNVENEAKFDLVCDWNTTKTEDSPDRFKNGKVPRMHKDSDASSALSPSVETVFNVEGAQQEVPSDFTFHLFGQGESEQNNLNVFPIVSDSSEIPASIDSPHIPTVVEQFKTPQSLPHNVTKQQRERLRRSKEPILSQAFPAKLHGYELRILQQPEEQHRARYLTEGSRGSVKNRSGTGYPVVKLHGHTGEATLQIFIGNDSGRVRPHGFYQACKVCGKNSTMCTEKDIDGTTVIEIELQSANDMTASIDCVGILKLRNADVEQRIGIAKAKKKSTKARMIFRVTFQKPCGNPQVLQVASSTILCTQPIGQPEICKMSLHESSMIGGQELYIIGKNFLRGTRVFFQEIKDEETVWEKEGEIDKDYFQTTHLIVTVPEYDGSACGSMKVACQVAVNSGGKMSDPQLFYYKQADPSNTVIKQDNMDIVEESRKRNYPFVAPEALELNQQIQQSQQVSNSSDMFQLPPGIISGMPETNPYTEMEQSNSLEPGTSNPSSTTPAPSKGYTTDTLDEDVTNLKQAGFGQENLEISHTTTWNTKAEKDVYEDPEKSMDVNVNNQLEYPSLNTEEFVEEDSMKPSYMRLKSPRLSKDGYSSDHIDLNSSLSESNIVSQFLQNMSMLKESDPMFCMNSSVSLSQKSLQANTILTTVNSQVLMTADTQNQTSSGTFVGNNKEVSTVHSYLKEALTCPQVSLEHPNVGTLQQGMQTQTSFIPKSENSVSAMDVQVDNTTVNNSQLQLDLHINDNTCTSPQAIDADITSPPSAHSFTSPTSPYTLPQASQVQQTPPFSPSHVLTSFSINQSPITESKPICSDVVNMTNFSQSNEIGTVHQAPVDMGTAHQAPVDMGTAHQAPVDMGTAHQAPVDMGTAHQAPIDMGTAHQTPVFSQAFLQDTKTNQDSHNNPMSQTFLGLSSPNIQMATPVSAVPSTPQVLSVNTVNQASNPSNTQSNIDSVLQKLLAPMMTSQQQQQTQPQFVLQQQQQAPVVSTTPPIQHTQYQQQQNIQNVLDLTTQHQPSPQLTSQQSQHIFVSHQQPQTQYQQPLFTQPQIQQLVSRQQLPTEVPPVMGSLSSVVAPTSVAVPSTIAPASSNQNPVAPQIIICNNAGPQGQLPQTQFNSPSIVIVPGQTGGNNQVENLLRSILGSMMQPQQQQQQPPHQ